MSEAAVFCDFDGTITAEETFVRVLKTGAPELAAALIPRMLSLDVTLRDGVRQILEAIPSSTLPGIVDFARSARKRDGLPELLELCDRHTVPFVVVSGGLRVMVEASLGPLTGRCAAIYGVDVDTTGPSFAVISPFEGGTELVEKVAVMARHPARERVAIGDSVTDLVMAQEAEVVFARDKLAAYLDERGVAYHPWRTFHDVREALERRWG